MKTKLLLKIMSISIVNTPENASVQNQDKTLTIKIPDQKFDLIITKKNYYEKSLFINYGFIGIV